MGAAPPRERLPQKVIVVLPVRTVRHPCQPRDQFLKRQRPYRCRLRRCRQQWLMLNGDLGGAAPLGSQSRSDFRLLSKLPKRLLRERSEGLRPLGQRMQSPALVGSLCASTSVRGADGHRRRLYPSSTSEELHLKLQRPTRAMAWSRQLGQELSCSSRFASGVHGSCAPLGDVERRGCHHGEAARQGCMGVQPHIHDRRGSVLGLRCRVV
mmetsp:Transcript_95475/g.269989  ORF Transcript_95475/g.269989 Transcript_95475/m.269989 type:complete len:210 (+) Transcript_95475:557-1186(+)